MFANTDDDSINLDEMEEWLKNYFLDPLTSYLDQSQFRIDLYETEKEWIVEAVLTDFNSSEVSVYIEEDKMTVTAIKYPPVEKSKKRTRVIEFPFQIINQKVTATFVKGILEVFISKTEEELGKNRYITLP